MQSFRFLVAIGYNTSKFFWKRRVLNDVLSVPSAGGLALFLQPVTVEVPDEWADDPRVVLTAGVAGVGGGCRSGGRLFTRLQHQLQRPRDDRPSGTVPHYYSSRQIIIEIWRGFCRCSEISVKTHDDEDGHVVVS